MSEVTPLEALHHSIKHGDVLAVRRYLESGGSPLPSGKRGWSPLAMATNRGHTPIIQLLLDAGADVNEGWPGESVLMLAAMSGSIDSVRCLLDRGAKTTACGVPSHELLVRLGHGSQKAIVQLLRDRHVAEADSDAFTQGE